MRKQLGILIAVALAASVSAGRANADWKPGCWVGVAAGMGMADTETSASLGGTTIGTIDGLSASGGQAGVAAGCDARVQQFVIGGFADYSFLKQDFSVTSPLIPGGSIASMSLDNQWTLGLRVGLTFHKNTLLYLQGGYTQLEASDIEIPIASLKIGTPTFKGYMLGLGIEHEFAPNLRFTLDGRWNKFQKEGVQVAPGVEIAMKPETLVGMARVSYAFDFFNVSK